jgi:hypothetical protein
MALPLERFDASTDDAVEFPVGVLPLFLPKHGLNDPAALPRHPDCRRMDGGIARRALDDGHGRLLNE